MSIKLDKVGLLQVSQTIPLAVTEAPPSEVTVPEYRTEVVLMESILPVKTFGKEFVLNFRSDQ